MDLILCPLIEDLKNLEINGILFNFDELLHHFKGTLSMVVADNLAPHALGVFFSVIFPQYKNFVVLVILPKLSRMKKLSCLILLWEQKNAYGNNIAINKDPYLYGIKENKENSVLNDLNYFDVADGLPSDLAQPPDLAHNLSEGFAVDIMSNVIASFIHEGLIDLDALNEIILNFAYSESDKNHKPQLVKVKPLNSLKVKHTACEMWSLIRLLPLMISSLVPLGNNVWSVYIEFVQIVEILCGTKFTNIDLFLLQKKIDTFFPKYMDFFPNIITKPKGHFLQHYPGMIRMFGPLIKTLRFESKNGYFKSTFQSNKNRNNVCYSMAERHQMLMHIHYAKSSLLDFKEVPGDLYQGSYTKGFGTLCSWSYWGCI